MNNSGKTLPLVSVLVRTRNRPKLLKECLESLTGQNIHGMEVIVINDGGEDVTGIIGEFSNRLKIIHRHLDPARGRCAAANIGIREARGQWLAFADDDDIWLAGGLKALLDAAEGKEHVCLYGGVPAVLHSRSDRSERNNGEEESREFLRFGREFDLDALLFENFIPIIGCLLPLDIIRDIGGIDETLDVFEDWDLFLRLSQEVSFIFVDQDVAEYRVFGSGFVTGAGGADLQISGRAEIYRKHWRMISPEALSRMQHYAKSFLIPQAVQREADAWKKRVADLKKSLDDSTLAVDELRSIIAEKERRLKDLWDEREFLEGERRELGSRLGDTEALADTLKAANQSLSILKNQLEDRIETLGMELAGEPTRSALVSIVIVNFNGLEHLKKCIPALEKTEKIRFEIIVVDNGSNDESISYLRWKHPSVRIVETGANLGFGEGNRRGVDAAKGQWIALLNNDTVVDPLWLYELLRIHLGDPSIGASCSTLCLMQHPEILNGVGGGMSKLGYGYDRRYGCPRETAGIKPVAEDVFFPTAAAMLMSRRDFDHYGFDQTFFMYHEDVDLGWRLWLSGRRVVVCRDSVVYHYFGGTSHSTQGLLWRERMGSRHNIRSILKHGEILTILKAFKGLMKLWLEMGAYRHILHVAGWNLLHLPGTLRQRRKIQKIRATSDAELIRRGFISPAPYPAPPPLIPLRGREFVRDHCAISNVLRPAAHSSLGRLDFGWYDAHPIGEDMVRPFCGHARCRLKVEPEARGSVEIMLHVPEAAATATARLRVNGKEISEKLSGELWQRLRIDDVEAEDDGVLEIDLITPTFRPHFLFENWDFRLIGGAVREICFLPETPRERPPRRGISVLITTFRRWNVLRMTLDALYSQNFEELEVIVMDDGSGDETLEELERYKERHPDFRLKVATQENTGQGGARNHALELVDREIVLFLGDDIIPSEGFLRTHLETHNSHDDPVAVVGFTDWYRREMKVTPFMDFVNFQGHQFGYAFMEDGKEQPFTCFYTSNISLPRSVLGRDPFDRSFSSYGWEDVELGYRLSLKGLAIIYSEKARASHYHQTTIGSFFRRMHQVGSTYHKLLRLHPELLRNPHMPPEHPPRWYRVAEFIVPAVAALADRLDRRGIRLPKIFLHHLLMIPFYRAVRLQKQASENP